MPQIRPPWTAYAVALMYLRNGDGSGFAISRIVTVSGHNPLTDSEATQRARDDVEGAVPALKTNCRFDQSHVSSITIE